MEQKIITDMELAMFLEDKLPEKECAEIMESITDVETLWILGEMTLARVP